MLRTLAVCYLIFVPLIGSADEVDAQYEKLVDEMLHVTGALKIGGQMSAFMVSQFSEVLKGSNQSVPDRTYEILETEVNLAIREELDSGAFNQLMYPVYRKYLDVSDLEAAIRFYKTEAGKKLTRVLPELTQDAMVAGQTWGASLGPRVAERVRARLAEEGVEVP